MPLTRDRATKPRYREAQVVALLLEGLEHKDTATRLGMARRTVKAHLNRVYTRLGIGNGVKRVKLAVYIYRRVIREAPASLSQNGISLSWLQQVLRTEPSEMLLARPSTLSKTTSVTSMIV